MAANAGSEVSKYETEEGLKEVAAFLRGRNGMPLRPAIEVDKRVEYFKGEPAEFDRQQRGRERDREKCDSRKGQKKRVRNTGRGTLKTAGRTTH